MAKVFLDANVIIDILEVRREFFPSLLDTHETYLSPLSLHIYFYVEKKKVPYFPISEFMKNNNLVVFTDTLTQKALSGPTADFEDNVQLHSAAEAECDFFLTEDRHLLDMKFFGKTQIVSSDEFAEGH